MRAGANPTSVRGAMTQHGRPLPAHATPVTEIERRLETDAAAGLTSEEAARRLERFGANAPSRPDRPKYGRIALRQFADPIVALLVVAAAVAAILGEQIEAIAIALIVVLNAALGFWQESGAERAVLALRDRFRAHRERGPRRPRARAAGRGGRPGRPARAAGRRRSRRRRTDRRRDRAGGGRVDAHRRITPGGKSTAPVDAGRGPRRPPLARVRGHRGHPRSGNGARRRHRRRHGSGPDRAGSSPPPGRRRRRCNSGSARRRGSSRRAACCSPWG